MTESTALKQVGEVAERRISTGDRWSLVESLRLEPASMADYAALASFHYRGGQPGAVTAVYRLVHDAPTVVGRFLQRRDETTIVGVLVRSLPHLGCALRNLATEDRYRGLPRRDVANLLNREVRTISRVVVHPQWRGLGLAVRLVRHALEHPETVYTESLAAMGRVHPFLERAGMRRYDRPLRAEAARVIDALDRLRITPQQLACVSQVEARINQADSALQTWITHELRRWHRMGARRGQIADRADATMHTMLVAARNQLLFQPVYYLAHHPHMVDRTFF